MKKFILILILVSFVNPCYAFLWWGKKDKALEAELEGKGYAGTLPDLNKKFEKKEQKIITPIFESQDGFVNPCCFELPVPHSQQSRCVPYSLLFISVLYDYLADTQDYRTANDLWRVAKRQMELVLESVGPDGVYEAPKNAWIFFDWRKDFDYNTSMQALCAISLDKIAELAKKLDRESEIEGWNGIAEKMRAAAKEKLYSPERRVFISGKNKQISVLSQAF